jgi:drug/metabolite transporter (DMT)-like permease
VNNLAGFIDAPDIQAKKNLTNPTIAPIMFIIMAIFWEYFFGGVRPDTYDIIGTIIASIGVIIIFYCPSK